MFHLRLGIKVGVFAHVVTVVMVLGHHKGEVEIALDLNKNPESCIEPSYGTKHPRLCHYLRNVGHLSFCVLQGRLTFSCPLSTHKGLSCTHGVEADALPSH